MGHYVNRTGIFSLFQENGHRGKNGRKHRESNFAKMSRYSVLKPLIARVPPSSDLSSWHQVFVQKQYEPVLSLLPKNPTILDLGANVGYASAYFQQEVEGADILAVELDPTNYAFLKQNFDGRSINAAVWSSTGFVGIGRDFADTKEWSYYAKDGKEIPSFTINDLMGDWKRINLLKMDIEGGEVEVFKDDSFLENVDVIAIEIHDQFKCRPMIYSSLMKHGFMFENNGEVTIGYRE